MTGAVWWSLALLLLVPELPGAGPAPVPPPAEPWSVRAEDRRLVRAARRAAGVWAGPHAPDPVFAHTVVVTASTLAYGAFLRNWVCRAEALHMWYLVVALDAPLYRALARGADPVGPVRYPALGPGAALALFDVERRRNLTAGAVSGAFHEFRGGRFNDLSCGKVFASFEASYAKPPMAHGHHAGGLPQCLGTAVSQNTVGCQSTQCRTLMQPELMCKGGGGGGGHGVRIPLARCPSVERFILRFIFSVVAL